MVDRPHQIESRSQLIAVLLDQTSSPEDRKIGLEVEAIGLTRAKLSPFGAEEGGRFEQVLSEIGSRLSGSEIRDGGVLHGIKIDDWTLTLEPGGQLEYSGPPCATIAEVQQRREDYFKILDRVGEEHEVAWLWMGVHPYLPPSKLPFVPKPRYELMRRYLPQVGSETLRMMQSSASVQVTLDGQDPDDLVLKYQCLLRCAPLILNLFANSPYWDGRASGAKSTRTLIWGKTAEPERRGIPYQFLNWDFRVEDYLEYVLDVPMFVLEREGSLVEVAGACTFREFMHNGFQGYLATISDFKLHLSTMFYEVRLKGLLEYRAADCVPEEYQLALPALLVGLSYDPGALHDLAKWLKRFSADDIAAAYQTLPVEGFQGKMGRYEVAPVTHDLLELAHDGLSRLEPDALHHLSPLRARVGEKLTLADITLSRLGSNLGAHDPSQVLKLMSFRDPSLG